MHAQAAQEMMNSANPTVGMHGPDTRFRFATATVTTPSWVPPVLWE